MNIRLNPALITSKAGNQIVITSSEGTESIILNPVGSWLWEKLEDLAQPGVSSRDLVEQLMTAFPEVPKASAETDVEQFLKKLSKHELISLEESPD